MTADNSGIIGTPWEAQTGAVTGPFWCDPSRPMERWEDPGPAWVWELSWPHVTGPRWLCLCIPCPAWKALYIPLPGEYRPNFKDPAQMWLFCRSLLQYEAEHITHTPLPSCFVIATVCVIDLILGLCTFLAGAHLQAVFNLIFRRTHPFCEPTAGRAPDKITEVLEGMRES